MAANQTTCGMQQRYTEHGIHTAALYYVIHGSRAPDAASTAPQSTAQQYAVARGRIYLQDGYGAVEDSWLIVGIMYSLPHGRHLANNMQQHYLAEQCILMYWFQAAERQRHQP